MKDKAATSSTGRKKHAWEDVIDGEMRQIAGNYETRRGFRSRPALLCIDNYNAVLAIMPSRFWNL
jgi:hypothetical protein